MPIKWNTNLFSLSIFSCLNSTLVKKKDESKIVLEFAESWTPISSNNSTFSESPEIVNCFANFSRLVMNKQIINQRTKVQAPALAILTLHLTLTYCIDLKNYRPILLLSVISKTIERIIKKNWQKQLSLHQSSTS